MKVISRGTQRITCKQCGSVLEYEWADIKEWNGVCCVICPVCGKMLEVEDKIENPYADLHSYPINITDSLKPYTLTPGYPYETFARDGVYASNTVSVCNDAITALSSSAAEGAAACSALAEACSTTATKVDELCTLTVEN